MMKIQSKKRINEIDAWRGLAIMGMVVFHVAFIVDFLGIENIDYANGMWHMLARAVQWSFLLLVGISLQLSFQKNTQKGKSFSDFLAINLKRAIFILSCAGLVSLGTYLAVPQLYVRFGILHLIGSSLILLGPFVNKPKTSLALALGVALLALLITTIESTIAPLLIFGVRIPQFATVDYFPLFPWLAVPACGIFLGSRLFNHAERTYPWLENVNNQIYIKVLAYIGRKSLLIYLVHVPIILLLLSYIEN